MNEATVRLSYRELADRLGISADAARMKAQRTAKKGRWRIIPGNHPSERVLVEVPANDLNATPERIKGVRLSETPEQPPNNIAERLLDELAAARSRNDELTDRLIAAKDVLTTAYEKLVSTNQELVAARLELVAAKEAHGRDTAELASAEMREMGTKAELERALSDLEALHREAAKPKRQWWQRR